MTDGGWVEKHRPENFDEIQGNTTAINEIRKWAENWSPGDEPQLLIGSPGTGKTTTAYVIADSLGFPLNEINTSSARKSDDIRRMAKAMTSTPVEAEHQVVLLDEVDSWHHASDKTPLYDAIKDPRNPVIMTANEKYEVPDTLKRNSNVREYKLGVRSRKAKLKKIASAEDLDLDEDALNKLAERPDLRSGINDLQTWSETGVPPSDDHREWDVNPFGATEGLLKGRKDEWRQATQPSSDMDPQWLSMWADENLVKEYRGLEAGVAYDILSRADKWVWTDRKYAAALLECLPDVRLTEPYQGYIRVNFPSWVRSSAAKHDGSTAEAKVFQALKGTDTNDYRMSGSFAYFKKRVLPILRDLDDEDKFLLILNSGIPDDAIEALDISRSSYEDWKEEAAPETGEYQPDISSAADW